jgi:NitT/TauT family transport system permease protein
VKRSGWIRLGLLAGALLLLELLVRTGVVSSFAVSPPSTMLSSLAAILQSGKYNADIAATLRNVAVSIVTATAAGVLAGTAIHANRTLRRVLDPLFATYYAIPIYAFYPLLLVLFGLGNLPQIAIGFLLAVVAVIISTLNGLDRVPRVLLKAAQVHRLGPIAAAWRVRLPCAAPYIFTGFKLAVAYSFVGVIGAEFIAASTGIGYEISFAYNNFDNGTMYALILFVLMLVITINMLLHLWEGRLLARRRRA